MESNRLTIHELQEKLRDGELTSVEITESVYRRIASVEGKVHSYITLMKDAAIGQAIDESTLDEQEGTLAGDNTILVLFADETHLETWLERFEALRAAVPMRGYAR